MSGASPPPGEGTLEGRVLGGHYLLGSRIGAGSMGVVYRARHNLLHREFAAKVLAPSLAGDAEARRRFLREAEALARIAHPNVVPVRHFGEEDGLLFLVMDLCEGGTLHDLLAREGALPERRAVRIALQVLQALDAAHWEGVVHRDLKPANVLVDPSPADRGEPDRVRVADFGLARVAESLAVPGSHASAPGTVAGTVAYMSPEQVRADADVDARSDLFSLGSVLHEMLGGRPPFDGPSTLTVAMRILEQPPPPLPEEGPRAVSAPIRAVLARALEKDRERRFPTASAMADALRDALAGVSPTAEAPVPGRGGNRILAAAIVLSAIAGAAGVAGLPWPGREADRPSAPAYDAARAASDRDLARRSLLDARFEAAIGAAERVAAANLATPEDLLLLARARAGLGDPADLPDLDGTEALIRRARSAAGRASTLRERGAAAAEVEAALEPLAAAAAALADDPRRGLVEGLGLLARGDADGARELASRTAEAHPDLAEAAFLYATCCIQSGMGERLPADADQARRWNERALTAVSDAVARARRRPDLHMQGCDLLRYWRTSCNVKYSLGDVDGAAADYVNELLARNPGCRLDLGVGAQYLQWAGRFEEALRCYGSLRRAGGGDSHLHGEGFCHMQIARMKAEAGDLPGALREMEDSVAKFTAGAAARPEEPAYVSYRAEAWLARARLLRDDAAAEALAKARADFDSLEAVARAGNPDVLFRRWEFLEAVGDREGALADIRAAVASRTNVTAAFHRRLAFSCIANAPEGADGVPLLEEAIRAADGAERWSPRRAELACIVRGDARVALAIRAASPAERERQLDAARADYAKAASLALLDPRVRAEARLRSAAACLKSMDVPGALREAEEAMRLRREANAARGSSLFVNDDFLRSPLAEFHRRLGEAYAAAGRPEDAAREDARAKALR